MLKTFSEEFLIRSYQADVTNHITPSAILQIMQEMAGAHAEMLDIGRSVLLNHNLVWILTRVEVQMDRYPTAGETLYVETFPMPNRRWFFPRYFIFRDGSGMQIGCAGSLWALLDVTSRRMSKPDPVMHMLPDNSDLTAPMGLPATVEEIAIPPVTAMLLPQYTDLDVNGHVNNTRYIDWCCNALGIDTMKQYCLSRFVLNFNQEILPGQAIRTELHRQGDAFSFSGFEGDTRHFDVGGMLTPRA
ncbi:MAG: hypothetical protein IJZ74_05005 [Clostridia bacterium]|nr:hypothetical protein [Clostridia bacterium]